MRYFHLIIVSRAQARNETLAIDAAKYIINFSMCCLAHSEDPMITVKSLSSYVVEVPPDNGLVLITVSLFRLLQL
jgi:hypothetical protein